jgi:hypothetical protein
MNTSLASRPQLRPQAAEVLVARDTETAPWMAVVGAGLLIAVAVIHLQDQGGLLGGESPTYLKFGYYLVELVSSIAAVLILRGRIVGWVLGLGSTALPFIGYMLSRSVGIPGDPGDIGNWGYLLGTVSLFVEGAFVALGAFVLVRNLRGARSRHESNA